MNIVKRRRNEKGLTQIALSQQLGIVQSTISNIERGQRKPSIALAIRLGEVLGFDWAEIYKEQPSESGKEG